MTAPAAGYNGVMPPDPPVLVLTYKYRLRPTKGQHRALERLLESQRLLYNAALEERIGCYRATGRGRSYVDQCKALTELRADSDFSAVPVNLQRWTLKRLDEAFAAFFRRVKARKAKAGFPRFRGKGRWDAFGFNEFAGIRFDGKRLRFKGLPGGLKVHLHRPLPEPLDIRACVFRRDPKGWAVCLQAKVAAAEPRPGTRAVGIDLGLKSFLVRSDGIAVEAPKFGRRAGKELRRRQRALARCKRGSRRRSKAKARVARLHMAIADARRTWLHRQSARLAREFDVIVAEKLNVAGMVRHPRLSGAIADAAWNAFLGMVDYKAERAGGRLIRVDPRNTTQACSACGAIVPKTLAERTHRCGCGLAIDRDLNAALNVLRAVAGPGRHNAGRGAMRAAGNRPELGTGRATKPSGAKALAAVGSP